MSGDVVTSLVAAQRRRLVASILGYAERELYADLSEAQRAGFRGKVLESVGVFSDFTLDCIRSSNQGWTVNEEAIQVLHVLSSKVGELSERVADLVYEEED